MVSLSARPGSRPTWRLALTGLIDTLTFVPSVFALGVIFGASAGPAGIGPLATVVMSLTVFSGAGQFAALPLWRDGGAIVALSALALSLRFSLMTASMAPALAARPRWMRALLAFTLTDENYALVVSRRGSVVEPAYLVGSWSILYTSWAGGTILGVLLGSGIPAACVGPLEAVFPLVFLVLTVLVCTSPALAAVAVLGGALSVAGALVLPNGWNVVVAGVLASLAGPIVQRLLGRHDRP